MITQTKAHFDKHQARLAASVDTVWLIARWLSNRKHTILIPPTIIADTPEQEMQMLDNGDLFIVDGSVRRRVEVKGISTQFFCKFDFEEEYEALMIGAKHMFDCAVPKPYMYVIVSRDKINLAVVLVEKTRKLWWVKHDVPDSGYEAGYKQDKYMCPLDLVEWTTIHDY